MEQVFVKLEHQRKVSVRKMELDEEEAKQPNFWKKSIELSSNHDFDQPDPKEQSIFQSYGGIKKNYHKSQSLGKISKQSCHEQREELGVDFIYDDFEAFLPVYDKM